MGILVPVRHQKQQNQQEKQISVVRTRQELVEQRKPQVRTAEGLGGFLTRRRGRGIVR